MSDIRAKFRNPRYREIDRDSFLKFLASFGFTEGSIGELSTYYSNGIVPVQVPNEPIIIRLYIIRIQDYLQNCSISENEFLDRLDKFRP